MMESMYVGDAGLLVPVLIGIGVLGIAIGFAWIRRITGAEDEGQSNWRFRR